MKDINDIPLILRREIEARMIKPFLEAFSKEIGEERTLEITEQIIEDLAKQAGKESAERLDCIYDHHNERFNVDESALKRGTAMHVQVAVDFLSTTKNCD